MPKLPMQPSSGEPRIESVRPFPKIHFPQKAINDLRQRIAATQWPEKETVADSSQGVPLATMRELALYWATQYDWRAAESETEQLSAIYHQH